MNNAAIRERENRVYLLLTWAKAKPDLLDALNDGRALDDLIEREPEARAVAERSHHASLPGSATPSEPRA